ncbi:CASPASE_P20 domain-containing protein [Caerostris darwini]|uniref:CASPASE_P20 domain-containing protein n=1 Tax=Caerostris darwini TaxID=1538125 RepID=A0AAV4TSJ4_9ARAC|nr:CASPASE_P20 domain-containing protein [Caerostris darwini]
MEVKHRKLIKKHSHKLENSINLNHIEDSLKKSKIFTVLMLRDILCGEASLFEELPTRGPTAFNKFITLLKENGYASEANEILNDALCTPAYNISFNKPGYCLIISSDEFPHVFEIKEELKQIYSCEAKDLDCVLTDMGYPNPDFKTNDTHEKLFSELNKFSKTDFSKVDSCVVIILSCGGLCQNSKIIFSENGKYVLLNKILNLFSDTNCPSLKYKPKIFFLPSFDYLHNDSLENAELLQDVNDTFIWHFPPLKNYEILHSKNIPDAEKKYFGQLLYEHLNSDFLRYDFETIVQSAYNEFIKQFNNSETSKVSSNCVKIGNCREKVLFLI